MTLKLQDFSEVFRLLEAELTSISFSDELLDLFVLLEEQLAVMNDGDIGLGNCQVLLSLESHI